MTKRKIVIIIAGILAIGSLAASSLLNHDISINTDSNDMSESEVFVESEEDSQLPDDPNTRKKETVSEDSKTSSELVDLSDIFVCDSLDFQIKEAHFSGPMCTELVIENTRKAYANTGEKNYPLVEFDSESDFVSIGWWPEGSKVYLQFWNIDNKKEAEFSIDGVKCKLILPQAPYIEIKLHTIAANLDTPYRLDSLYIYNTAAVLNLEMSTADFFDIREFKLKMENTDLSPCRINYDETAGKIEMLYLFDAADSADTPSEDIQGIIYNGECIYIK